MTFPTYLNALRRRQTELRGSVQILAVAVYVACVQRIFGVPMCEAKCLGM